MRSLLNLEPVLTEPLDWRFRSFPEKRGVRIGDVAAQKWNLFESGFFFPTLVLKRGALEHNLDAMARFCAERGVLHAPHGKTTMAPQLFERQLAAGAWGITAATVEHARIYRAFGVPRILMANELVGRDEARWIAAQMAKDPGFDFLCYVDSAEGVRTLAGVFRDAQRPLGVLLELGVPGGRTGCRTNDEAIALAREVAGSPGLAVLGVSGFEGILGSDRVQGSVTAVDSFCDRLSSVARDLVAAGLASAGDLIVSAGGSAYPDRVAERLSLLRADHPHVKIVIRSGCYVTHDDGFYERVSPFASRSSVKGVPHLEPALELWATIVSRPEPGIAVAGFGKRDAPFDADLPNPRTVRAQRGREIRSAEAIKVSRLNDQHAYLAVSPEDPLAPGDLVSFGVSHPCLAFDRWPLLPLVDDEYTVVDAIRTFF